jgi:threonine dehydrogenase-like Zn-dependent dehydrogenase
VKGSVAGMGEDMHDALTLLAHKRFDTEPFTASTYPLAFIQEAFETLKDRPGALKTQIAMQP